MANLNYKIVGNLSHVRTKDGMQLSVAYLLIDQHPEEHRSGDFGHVRQLRGYNWGGMHVFTVWIKHEDELEITGAESNTKLISHDGTMKDIGPTGVLTIGEFKCSLVKSDMDQPFVLEDCPCEINDPEQFLGKVEAFYKAPYIPVTVHVPVKRRRQIALDLRSALA